MNREALSASVIPEIATRRLTINLVIQENGLISVQSCEISGKKFLNRTSFRNAQSLSDVFVDELATTLDECLTAMPEGAHMLSLPDFLIEIPGLTLSGARILVSEIRGGARNVIIRIKEFLGAFVRVLKPNIGFDEALSTNTEKLALSALMDICIPILNFARSPELKMMDPDGRIRDMTEMKLREFEFNAELLKRFAAVDTPQPELTAQEQFSTSLLT